jgi:hypothetical protein
MAAERLNIIIVTNGQDFEAWGSLTEICTVKGLATIT